jgi:hypothetical protein
MGAILKEQFNRENVLLAHGFDDCDIDLAPAQRNDSHAVQKLQWLEEQVSPTVRRLKKLGYEQEIREIFGLTDEA